MLLHKYQTQMFDIEIRMDIKPDTEYMLVFKLDGKDEETVRYYTRIVINDNYHADELLDFVQKFNAATFEFDTYEEASLIYPYMQSLNRVVMQKITAMSFDRYRVTH